MKNKTGHRSAFFCVEDVDFVLRWPEFVEEACIQIVMIQGVSVIDKYSVVCPSEPESKHAVETKVCIWYLKHIKAYKV